MKLGPICIRIAAEALFFACIFAGLYWGGSGNPLCEPPYGLGVSTEALRLAALLILWDTLSIAIASFIASALNDIYGIKLSAAILGVLIAVSGFFYAPFFMSQDYGVIRFRGTSLDCACFFTEGWADLFPTVVCPLLAVGTIAREVALQLLLRHVRRRGAVTA